MKRKLLYFCVAFANGFISLKPVYAVDLQRGQRIYNAHCAVCHGMNGVPVIQQAPSFASKDRLMQPDVMLIQSVKTGKTLMPPFMGILRDEEILDAIHYARILR